MPKHDPVPVGDATSSTWLADLQRDLRYAGRTMRRSPLFVLFVILTLGLGIGANTTVFTVINTLILNPMPVSAPSELMAVASGGSAVGARSLEHADAPVASELRGLSAPEHASFARSRDTPGCARSPGRRRATRSRCSASS